MRITVIALFMLVILFIGSIRPALAQGPTETPTPTSTATATPTITPTYNLYAIAPLDPSGQAGGVLYLVSAGEAGIFAELTLISIILMMFIFLALRRRG